MDQQEYWRQRVNDVAYEQTVPSVDFKQVAPGKPGDQSLITERIHNGEPICNGREQHGDDDDGFQQAFDGPIYFGAMNGIREYKPQDGCDYRRDARYLHTVANRCDEFSIRPYGYIMPEGKPLIGFEGTDQ